MGLLSGSVLFGSVAAAQGQLHGPNIHIQPHASSSAPAAASTPTPATTTTTIATTGQTSDQKIRLSQYVDKTNAFIHSTVHVGGKAVSDEERKAIAQHWRLSMRLLRCRDLASNAGDQASVSLVDADLATLDAKFDAELKALNAKAPK